jgi:transcriptional regulator with XRE-family HTH domain
MILGQKVEVTMPNIDPNALQEARKRQKPGKMSQSLLAEKIGVAQRTIAAWEKRATNGDMPSISDKNLQKLATALNVEAKCLTGEEPMPLAPEKSKSRLSAAISASAMFGYDVLENRYGIKRDELIEAAPMLFEALHHIFLKKRQEKLDEVRKLASTIESIVPTPWPGSFAAVSDVPGWGPDGWGVGASLDYEQSEIDRRAPFTPSCWDEIHEASSSNRFADMLHELEVPAGQLAVLLEEGAGRFPDYLVGLEELRVITGVSPDEPVSHTAKQAACAVLERAVRLVELPDIDDASARVDWLASHVDPADPQEEYHWVPFSEHQTDCLVPRRYTNIFSRFRPGLEEDAPRDSHEEPSPSVK